MLDTMTRYLESIHPQKSAWNLRKIFLPGIDRLSSVPVTTAGLVITGSAGTTAKIGAADFYALVQGKLVKIASGTSMPAITGVNFGAGAFNTAWFYVDGGGTVHMLAGGAGATLGACTMPVPNLNQALVGFLIITYASAFTGGTTALDTATTVYVSPVAGLDPSALV